MATKKSKKTKTARGRKKQVKKIYMAYAAAKSSQEARKAATASALEIIDKAILTHLPQFLDDVFATAGVMLYIQDGKRWQVLPDAEKGGVKGANGQK